MIEQYNGRPDLSRPIAVLYAGREQCAPGHRWEGVRDHYLIHYVTGGRGFVWSHGRPVALEAGGVFFFGPADRLRYEADRNHPWTYLWVGFTGSHAHELFEDYMRATGSPEAGLPYRPDVAASVSRILDVLDRRRTGAATLVSGLLQVAVGSIVAAVPVVPLRTPAPLDYGTAAAEFIDLNFHRAIRVADVAARIGVDRSHLSRVFRARWGTTVRNYLISRRMARAKELLAETTLPIRAVAQSAGYESYVTFERRFAERTGMAPTIWRATMRRDAVR